MLDAAKVVVHDLVAPPVQLVRRRRRPLVEREEAAVDADVSRAASASSVRARKRRAHLLLEGSRVEPVDVVVAVVGEQQAAVLDEARSALALPAAEPHQLVAGHEQERKRQQLVESAAMTTSSG